VEFPIENYPSLLAARRISRWDLSLIVECQTANGIFGFFGETSAANIMPIFSWSAFHNRARRPIWMATGVKALSNCALVPFFSGIGAPKIECLMSKKDEQYSDEEIARRRDEVIRRMATTPPRPHSEMKLGKSKTLNGTAKERPASKGRVHKGRTRT
jgi:hypothetical protein